MLPLSRVLVVIVTNKLLLDVVVETLVLLKLYILVPSLDIDVLVKSLFKVDFTWLTGANIGLRDSALHFWF